MREPIVADQRDFECWLVDEVAVHADMCKRIEDGTSRQTGLGAEMAKWHFTSLLMVLGRYTDRDQRLLMSVAADRKALLEVIRNGPSLMAECERQTEELYQKLEGEGKG